MKKLAIILSVVILVTLFLSSCATIEKRYTGKRIMTDPADYEYGYESQDYGSRGYYPYDYYYDPYYVSSFGPYSWFNMSFWNPFWYYGFLGSYYYWSPYYMGYYPYSYYWGRGYYPYYRGSGYYPYRSTYRTYIRKNQLSRGRTIRTPSIRKNSSTSSVYRTGTRTRSYTPATRPPATRTRTSSRTSIKKKK
jgi:hypothetical protein